MHFLLLRLRALCFLIPSGSLRGFYPKLSSTDKHGNTKQGKQNKYNQSKKENSPRWVGSIWLLGLLLRHYYVNLSKVGWREIHPTQCGSYELGWDGWVI
jgi:hypothetical protein